MESLIGDGRIRPEANVELATGRHDRGRGYAATVFADKTRAGAVAIVYWDRVVVTGTGALELEFGES